jgi:NADP-dependent 3-hydroxy acid dehydrogenase YdfG
MNLPPPSLTPAGSLKLLISGGTTGIGRETALLLGSAGASIFIHGRDPGALKNALALLHERSIRADGLCADVSKTGDMERVFAAAEEFLGGMNAWVSCAALGWSHDIDAAETDWQYVVETNLGGTIRGTREAVRAMKRSGGGRIILVGSMSAEVREAKSSVYIATKAGVRGFAAALRKEINGQGIGVSLVEPGACATDLSTASTEEQMRLHEAQEMLHPHDVAGAIEFLLTRPQGTDVVSIQIRPRRQLI